MNLLRSKIKPWIFGIFIKGSIDWRTLFLNFSLASLLFVSLCLRPAFARNLLEKEQNRKLLEQKSKEYLGATYKYGSSDSKKKIFDCSGLVRAIVLDFLNEKDFPRTAQLIFNYLAKYPSIKIEDAQLGDFVFFKANQKSGSITHVALYWGMNEKKEHLMYHASSSRGVEFRNINSSYWRKKFVSVKRYQPFYKLFN